MFKKFRKPTPDYAQLEDRVLLSATPLAAPPAANSPELTPSEAVTFAAAPATGISSTNGSAESTGTDDTFSAIATQAPQPAASPSTAEDGGFLYESSSVAELQAAPTDNSSNSEDDYAQLVAELLTADAETPSLAPQAIDHDNDSWGIEHNWSGADALDFNRTRLRREIAFVDTSVQDYTTLVAGILASNDGTRDIEIVLLDEASDGITQIRDTLATRPDIDAIHLVTHGTHNSLRLGSTRLDLTNLQEHADVIREWGHALTASGDILVYGCDLASTEDGQSLLGAISELAQADVAGSDDATGSASMSADWTLEYLVGEIESQVAMNAVEGESWAGLLATLTVTNTNDSGAGSLRAAMLSAVNGDVITFNIAGVGPHTINVASALPTITQSITIDGWTEPDYSSLTAIPAIVVNGNATNNTNGFRINASNVTIRGLTINRFDAAGIYIESGSNNVIQGNFIGTDSTGNALAETLGAMSDGIRIQSANNVIGGATVQIRNVIAGSDEGIRLNDAAATGNIIRGNLIGVSRDQTVTLGVDDDGIDIGGGAAANTIGGTGVNEGNVIAGASDSGIEVRTNAGAGNVFLRNSIYLNGGIAIDVNANGSSGNFPVLASASSGAGVTTIGGTLSGAANTTYRVEFFSSGPTFADSNGEARVYLGHADITTNAAGSAVINSSLNASVNHGDFVSATMTPTGGETSELSANRAVTGLTTEVVVDTRRDVADAPGFGTTLTLATLLSNRGADGVISLREAIDAANRTSGLNTIRFNLPGGAQQTINLVSALPTIIEAVHIDATTDTDFTGAPVIELNGASAGTNVAGFRLASTVNGGSIRGFVINRFSTNGILLDGADNVVIAGNYIGADFTGQVDRGNTEDGIQLQAGATGNTIGGLTASDRNIISGNDNAGLAIDDTATANNLIIGNYIGLAADGLTAIGNTHDGIHLVSATNNTIGGITTSARNVIASNAIHGIGIDGANGTRILGNYIGVAANGTSVRGNLGDGIRLSNSVTGTVIGGTTTPSANVIANNLGDGVLVNTTSGTAATILGNSIFANGEQAIDLGADNGLTYNDVLDADSGANNLLNFPELQTATSLGDDVVVTGKMRGAAATTYRVEIYRSPFGTGDVAGYGEARELLGTASVTTDSSGNATFSVTLPNKTLLSGDLVTATATVDLGSGNYGATSEFGGNILANRANMVLSGSYTGNGLDNRVISGLGFRPEAVIVIPGNSTQSGVLRTSTMTGDASKRMTGSSGLVANLIQSLNGDGFTIGNDNAINASGTTYYWMAFGAGDQIDLGAYNGNGSNQTITGVGFQADLTMFATAGSGLARFHSPLDSSDTFAFDGSSPDSNGVTGYNADGFTVSSGASINDSGQTIHYIAFNADANYFRQATYVGNSSDNRSINGVGFQPELMWVRQLNSSNNVAFKTTSTGPTTDNTIFPDSNTNAANNIQSLHSEGFIIGSDDRVNKSSSDFGYFAFKQIASPLIVDTTSDIVDGSTASASELLANKGADGRISLREAILAANNTAGEDHIYFNIVDALVGGAHTINLTSALPTLTDKILLDASTDFDFAGSPVVVLNGAAAGAGAAGITLGDAADGSVIRGLVIRGFQDGIVGDFNSNNHLIVGNYLGVDVTGSIDQGNSRAGILLRGEGSTIGGNTSSERNLISGNDGYGIYLDGGANNNVIIGNWIGVNSTGNVALGNTFNGIFLGGNVGNQVGGTAVGEGNVIGGNGDIAVRIEAGDGHTIQGNSIGVGANGVSSVGNLVGVSVRFGSTDITIGGTSVAAANRIWNNSHGVLVEDSTTSSVAILGNSIANNVQLGIDLGADGVSSNDVADADLGPNDLQNSPELTSVFSSGGQTYIRGSIDSAANQSYRVEFFSSPVGDISGHGEGLTFLGAVVVATDATGRAYFSTTLDGLTLNVGEIVTATATQALLSGQFGATSEFAENVTASDNAPPIIDVVDNLLGHWRFENSPVDSSGNNYDGEFRNGAASSSASVRVGVGAVSLDGLNEFVDLSPHASTLGTLSSGTIAGWIKTSSSGINVIFDFADIADPSSHAQLGINNGNLFFEVIENGVSQLNVQTIGQTLNDNQWHHVAVTVGSIGNQLYVDGELLGVGSVVYTSGAPSTTTFVAEVTAVNSISIGAGVSSSGLTNAWNGQLDEVRLYGHALAAYEIDALALPALNLGLTVSEGASGVIDSDSLAVADADTAPSALVYTLQSLPSHGTLLRNGVALTIGGVFSQQDINNNLITYQHSGTETASDTFQFTVVDGVGGTLGPLTFEITILPVNDTTPVITSNGGGATAALNVAENNSAVTTVVATDADLPAQTLTYSISGGADAARFSMVGSSGVLTFAAAPNFESPTDANGDNIYEVVVQASDGTLIDTQTLSVTVIAVNDNPPVITSNGGGATAAVNVAENNSAVTTVIASDADLPAQTPTYSITGGADAVKFSIVGSSGVLTFAAAPNFESPTDANGDNIYEVVVQASDGTLTDTQTLSVTVTAVNDNPPVITSNGGGSTGTLNVAENNTAVTTVIASDADLPAQTLTYSITGGADAVKFSIVGSSGVLTFATAPNFESPTDANGDNIYEVVVQASDGTLTDTQTLSVTVTAVNDNPPVITSNGGGATAALNVAENNSAVTTVVATDTDLPAQTLTYSITGGADAAKFSIVGSSGVLTFAAAPNFESPTDANGDNIYEVVVQASDGTLTDTQTLSVTVTAVNDNPPVITSNGGGATGTLNVAEDNTAVTTVVASDADLPAQTLTYSITGGADAVKFSIVGSSGVLTFATAPNFESPTDANGDNIYEVVVQASDGTLTDTQTLSVTVTAVNDNPPVITSNGGGATAALNVAENNSAVTTVVATDTDLPAQTLTYSITGGADAAKFSIVGSSGVLTFAAAPNFESPTDANGDNIYEVVVQASDGTLTDTQTLSVTVTAVNDNPPVITSNGGGATGTLNVAEDNTAVTTVVATDADLPAQTLTYSISGGADAAKFSIVGSSGVLTFAAAPNFESPTDANGDNIYEVVVQASDGTLTDTQTLSVTVTAVNDNPPVINSNGGGATAALNVAENSTAVTTVVASDADLPAQTLTYSITGGADAAKFSIVGSSGVLTFAAAPNFESPTDANGDNIYEVVVQASDGTLTDTQTLSVTVTAVNDNPPVINSNGGGATAALNVAENSTAVTTVVATDADLPAQTLTYSITGGADAAKFSIVGSSGVLTFAAAPNFESPTDANGDNIYEVVVQASDGTLTDTQTLSVTVTAVNDNPPVINSNGGGATAALNVAENSTAVTTVVASDADLPAQTLTYSITGGADAAKFSIVGSSGVLTFAAAPNFESPTDANGDNIYEVVVQASDGTLTDTQTLSVTVTAVNDNPPVITSNGGGATGALSVLENSTAVTTVVATDADLPTQTLTYSITGGADAAKFSIDGSSGVLTFATAPNFDSPTDSNSDNIYQVIVQVSDGSFSTTQTLSVSVVNVNEPPVGADGSVTALEDSDYVFTASNFGFTDPLDSPPNVLNAVRIATLPAVGTLTNNGLSVTSGQIISVADITAGRLVYRAPNNANGLAFTTLTFQVQDNGGTANGGVDWDATANTLTINVTAINDSPTSTAPTTATVTAGTSLVFSSSTGNSLTVSDIDASTVRVSLTASEGTLSLSTMAGLTFTAGDGVGDSAMVFTGTLAAINTALNGLNFANAINHSGSDTITFTVNDLGGTGVGGPQQASKTISVTITSPTVPIIGDTFLKGDYLQVGIGTDGAIGSDGQAPSGYVSAGQQLGVEVDPERDGWATYDGDFILPGTPEETWGVRVGGSTYSNSNVQSAQISGALTNYSTSSSVESVDWVGSVGGLNIDTTYQVGKDNLYIDVAVSLTNATAATMSSVYYYRNVDPDNNVLQGASDGYKTTNTIISQGNDGSGVAFVKATQSDGSYLGLMGFGDNARVTYGGFSNRDVQAIYNGSSTLLQSGSRTADEAVSLAFKVDSLSSGETTTLHFRYYFGDAVEPTIDLDPNDSGTAIGSNFSATFTEGGGSIAITDTDATVFDSDSSNLTGMTIRITNLLDVGSESLTATTTGAITANFSGDTLTLSGVDSAANYRQVLRSIRYNNSSLDPDTSTRVITFQASDGVHASNVASALVTINATNNAPIITSPSTLIVAENTISLLAVTSTDPDGAARIYSITGGADASKFAINSALGTLSFLSAPNFESPTDVGGDNIYQVQVTANDQQGGTAVQTITISITDVDEFDLTPISDSDSDFDKVTENAAVGATVGITAHSVDDDATNNTITYSLDDDSNGEFTIDSQTGVITVAANIDRESGPTRSIIIRATSADNSTVTQAYLITVNDVDEFDATPLVDNDGDANNVTENAAIGATVGITAHSVDDDATNNTIVYSLDDDSNGEFTIDSQTGVVTVAANIDREVGPTRSITIRATSADNSTVTQAYLITVNDVDEFDATPIVDDDGDDNNVTENAAVGTTIGITAHSVDDDATNNTITYSLDDDSNGEFTIDSQTGVITVAANIDREAGPTRSIAIRATSADNSTVTQAYLITVNDVDEFDATPLVDNNGDANNVTENAAVGTTVGITAHSVDDDATNSTIVYSLDDDSNGEFTIDSQTGVVTVAANIDRESGPTRSITIRATSADNSTVTQSYLITVNDVDEFDATPLVDNDGDANNVTENTAVGATVGITALSVDDDATNNTIVYSLDDDSNGEFTIDSQTGVVTVAANIDRESGPTRSIIIRATSADNSTVTQSYLITVNDVDEFDATPLVDNNGDANNVTENAAVGTTVGITAHSVDDDATNNTIVYSLDDDSNGEFTIDSQTGVVTVAANIDRESGPTRSITIRATSADNSTVTQAYLITVNDVDEFDATPLVDNDGDANNVTENAAVGATVGITALSVDDDATNNTIVYSLDDDSNGEFTIDSQTGVVTVAANIDREAGPTRSITIRATSADNSTVTQAYLITVNDVDEFDATPLVDNNGDANNVTENAAVGTTVGITAHSVDDDATNNTIVYSLDDDSNGEFTIDSQTGVVTVAANIDREAGPTRSITIRATSADISTVTQAYLITVNDVDEFDATPLVDDDGDTNNVTENAAVGATVGITALSVDDDATNNTIVYSLDDDSNGEFTIDSQTGVVTVAANIDRESGPTRSIIIRATSADNSTVTQSYLITVNDLDEFDATPLVDDDGDANNVTENAAIGATVGITAHSVDDDATNNTIVYSLDDDSNGEFTIDSQTGVVTVAANIDRESGPTRSITIRATSADNSTVTQSYLITVNDVDEFDATPLVDNDGDANNVTENTAVGATVGITALSVDDDATNNTIVYSLDDDSNGEFTIDSQTGVVTVAANIDRESGPTRSIIIRATSADNSTVTQAYLITVNDVDEFDATPLVDNDGDANNVTENTAVGATVGITALSVDDDATNNTILYSLDDDSNGEFTIDSQTGVVTVAANIDRESGPTRSITIRATSADNSTVTQSYLITVNDVDEFDATPLVDDDGDANNVTENAAVGATVGITALSVDDDATNNTIVYSLDDDSNGEFTIDSQTGVVTVAANIDREAGPTRSITIRATSADNSTVTQAYLITINDVDEFDATPIVDNDGDANNVTENAAVGSTVGITALSVDDDATSNTIVYSLDDDSNGEFTIDSQTGVVTVAANIDRESGPTRSIIIRATSADNSTVTQAYLITVNDVDEFDLTPIVDLDIEIDRVTENSPAGTIVHVTAFSFDADATNNTITYSLDDDAGGRFAVDSQTGLVTVADGSLLNFELDTSHTIILRAESDDGSTITRDITIVVEDINENVAIGINTGATLLEGGNHALLPSELQESDPDDSGAGVVFTVISTVSHGKLTLLGTELLTGGTFTQEDIDSGRVAYQHNGGETTSDVLSFSVMDGGEAGTAPITDEFRFSITPVNDAPIAAGERFVVDSDSLIALSQPGILANDSDAESTPLQAILVTSPSSGTLTFNSDGSLLYRPDPNFDGYVSFSYRVDDGQATSNVVWVTIEVNNVYGPGGGSNGGPGPTPVDKETPPPTPLLGPAPPRPAASTSVTRLNPEYIPPPERQESQTRRTEVVTIKDDQIILESRPIDFTAAFEGYREQAPIWSREWSVAEATSTLDVATLLNPQLFWERLTDFERELTEETEVVELTVGTVALASFAFTAGYIFWTIKGGSLLISIMSQFPAWRYVDPLPIYDASPNALGYGGEFDDEEGELVP